MHWRAPMLFAVVLAVLIALWFSWPQDEAPDSIPTGEPAIIAEAQPSQDAPEIDAATAPAGFDAPRESAVEAKEAPLPVEEAIAILSVRVVDEAAGAALSGVRLYVIPQNLGQSWSSTHVGSNRGSPNTSPISGDDGRVEFELLAGVEYRLNARSERGNAGSADLDLRALLPGERHEVTLRLPTGLDLHYFGRVLDRESMTPIVGASVRPVPGGRETTWSERSSASAGVKAPPLEFQTTDAQGRFDLWCASWAGVDLQFDAPGYATTFAAAVKDHGTPEAAKVILLSRTASLRARLIDAGGGTLTNGSVRLWTAAYNIGEDDEGQVFGSRDPEWRESAGSDGFCLLEGLPPAIPFRVEILQGSAVVRKDLPTISLNPGELREVEWRIGSGCRLHGSVVEQDGTAVRNREIWLERAAVDANTIFETTDADDVALKCASDSEGRFSFSDVSPGRWWIGPAAERDEFDAVDANGVAPFAEVIEIPDGAMEQEVILRVHRGLYIRGVVLDPAGKPKPETYVFGVAVDVGAMTSARTGTDGKFTMGPLVPGSYSLEAHGWEDANSKAVEAKAGEEGVVLQLEAAGSIRGTVVDGVSGKPCEAHVTYSMPAAPDSGFGIVSPRGDGTFRIEGLEPGAYDLVATASGARVGVLKGIAVQRAIETSDVVISLLPGATLSVRYTGAEGYLHYRVLSEGTIVGGDGIAAGGREEIAVPSGRIVVEFAREGREQETREVEMSAGEHEELVLGGS